ncbi:MAG: hypothetical protein QW767_01875 [Thermoprotei archaeon]
MVDSCLTRREIPVGRRFCKSEIGETELSMPSTVVFSGILVGETGY